MYITLARYTDLQTVECVVKRVALNKLLGVAIASILVLLIFTVLVAPAMGVDLGIGGRSPSSTTTGGTVTFSDVNITISNVEHIPLVEINFSIYNNANDALVEYVLFSVDGTETADANSRFAVSLAYPSSSVLSSWYVNTTGYDIGYGYHWGYDSGYGYGYGDGSESDITISYTVVYTTFTTGTFYGKFSAYATMNSEHLNYTSASSNTFTVTSGDGGGGGTPTPPDDDGEEPTGEEGTEPSDEVVSDIEDTYGVSLPEKFYANDTDGDGIVDSFTDPNNVLTTVNYVNISGNHAFLLSTDDDEIPEFYWDTTTGTVTPVTYAPATIEETYIDEEDETVTVVINVEKGDWIYIELPDDYQEAPLITVKNASGREIPSSQIWRQNDKIYILDDPTEQYVIVYDYSILLPTFSPITGSTFDTRTPTISMTYAEAVEITQATLNDQDVLSDISQITSKVHAYKPTTDLANGTYTLSITAQDIDGNEITASTVFVIDVTPEPTEAPGIEIPWYIYPIIIIIIIILVVIYLFKVGYLYVEYEEPPPEVIRPGEQKKKPEIHKKKEEKKSDKK